MPKWSGTDKSVLLVEYFGSIEDAVRVGNWSDQDCVEVAVLKLTDAVRKFYSGSVELHADQVTWAKFKCVFRHRFRDVHTD